VLEQTGHSDGSKAELSWFAKLSLLLPNFLFVEQVISANGALEMEDWTNFVAGVALTDLWSHKL